MLTLRLASRQKEISHSSDPIRAEPLPKPSTPNQKVLSAEKETLIGTRNRESSKKNHAKEPK